jgi:hypothetical protein
MAVQTAVAANSESWLPPAMASPPKSLIVRARKITSVAKGMSDTTTEGLFMFDFLSINSYFGGKYTQNIIILVENIEKEAPREYDIWLFFLIFAYNMRNLWYDYRS